MSIKQILLATFLLPTVTFAAASSPDAQITPVAGGIMMVPMSKDDHSLDSLDKNPLAVALLKPNQLNPISAFPNPLDGGQEQITEWLANNPLKEALCHHAAFKIVCGNDYKESTALPLASWQKLNFFEKNNSMLKLNRTKTYLGQAAFAQLLLNPCTTAAEITKRQEAIRYLVEHHTALREMNDALKAIHTHEPKMFRWWYHNQQAIRKSGITNPWIKGITTRSLQLLGFALPFISAYGFYYFSHLPYNDQRQWGLIASAEGCAFSWIFSMAAGFDIYNLRIYQSLLIPYARIIDAAQNMASLISQYPALKNIPGAEELTYYCSAQSGDLHRLKQLLNTKTFASEASIFSSAGNIQAAHNLLYATAQDMYKLLQAIGKIDACTTMATLVRDHALQPNKYCFVDFAQGEQPTLEAVNMWSSACSLQTPLLQTVALTGNKRNLLVTGPFRSGKSTTLRAVCHAVLMAQAFGVAPAEQFRLQPFSLMSFTTADIKKHDAPASTESPAHHLLFEKLDTLTPDQNALVVFDSAQEQWTDQAIAHQAQLLNRYPNTLSVFSGTNEQLALDNFAHYHMSPAQEQDRLPAWMFVLRQR